MIICCACQSEGPDRSKCAAASGGLGECPCDCHAATHVVVELNRAEIENALKAAGASGLFRLSAVPFLCNRWGVDK